MILFLGRILILCPVVVVR